MGDDEMSAAIPKITPIVSGVASEAVNQQNEDTVMQDIDQAMMEAQIQATAMQQASKKNSHRMFLDDVEYLSFVRRLSWSPDGNFFLTPASVYQELRSDAP
jgi:hypothetical protein